MNTSRAVFGGALGGAGIGEGIVIVNDISAACEEDAVLVLLTFDRCRMAAVELPAFTHRDSSGGVTGQ